MNTTPGKWLVRAANYGLNIIAETDHGNHVLIAQVAETSTKVNEPERAPFDAALISAAPELLRTLEQILDCNKRLGAISRPVADEARAAIAKAKGGQ